MAKSKTSTPQELYRARKQREEQEKTALLPPGLINHGNTCFMNSVLQGLIATRLLSNLVHFEPIPTSAQQQTGPVSASRKSPLLTNGHKLGGQYEQPHVETMPIGDVFLDLMVKSWHNQSRQMRESLSPKPLLGALGKKYEQYLDFAQQDAHEFLRILLDATRMEELDVIKKRQPLPEKVKKRRRTTLTPSNGTLPSLDTHSTPVKPDLVPEQERLLTVADMVFGGKFASILVCQECKNVSLTYEDFNDISLSIKAEDYHGRKRDRLKNLAKRLTSFPTTGLGVTHEVPRPLSVPPSPREREDRIGGYHDPPGTHELRRRSLDVVAQNPDADQNETAVTRTPMEDTAAEVKEEKVVSSEEKPIDIPLSVKPEKKDRKDDGWAKFSRRIGMTVGLGRPSKDSKSRSRDRTSKDLTRPSTQLDAPQSDVNESGTSTESEALTKPTKGNIYETTRPSPLPSASPHSSTSALGANNQDSLASQRTPSPASSLHRHKSHKPRLRTGQQNKTPKPPKPPKPTAEELNYLHEILADIGPASLSNPFALLKPPYNQPNTSSRSVSGPVQNLWLNQSYSGIEECLRMFTAVEVLEGENMVGCRRCWKIAHGEYEKTNAHQEDDEEEDSDNQDQTFSTDDLNGIAKPPPGPTPLISSPIPTSMSTPTISFYSHTKATSVSSLTTFEGPSLLESDTSSTPPQKLVSNGDRPLTPGGLPIPYISTTGPDPPTRPQPQLLSGISLPPPLDRSASLPTSASGSPLAQPTPRLGQLLQHLPPSNRADHLPLPRSNLDAEESSGAESDASAATSVHSTGSSTPAKRVIARKKPKPVIMRQAYKRYLIGTPPPVLVVHLKRFQQINKTHMLSFSHGFKKLDDFVTFPEFLDLTPYLAPRKEDFGLGKKGQAAHKPRDSVGRCMYRLYSVVVHIGNMLGGHYIAYTALPNPRPTEGSVSDDNSARTSPDTSSQRQWAYISDTIVRLTTLEEVLKAKAYICMYERI